MLFRSFRFFSVSIDFEGREPKSAVVLFFLFFLMDFGGVFMGMRAVR